MIYKKCGAKMEDGSKICNICKNASYNKKIKKINLFASKESRFGLVITGVIIAVVIGIGVYSLISESTKETNINKTFDTSISAIVAAEENEYQYSDSVVEINSRIFSSDHSRIAVREAGTNAETTLVTGNFIPGIVTDAKTLYYYDADKDAIMSLDVDSKKTIEVIKVKENVKPDEKSYFGDGEFARFDGKYKDYLYYQVMESEDYAPNYLVNVKTGEVKKLGLTDYGTYKFQIAGGKLYFDIYRTINSPTVLYCSDPEGNNIKTIAEGITNFEIIGEKLYYFKVEDMQKSTNKVMCMNLEDGKTETLIDGMPFTSGGFTSYGMISDKTIGNTLHTVVDYYDGGSEMLNGNGAKICSEVAIMHAGVPEDITDDKAFEMASVPEWYVVGNGTVSQLITLPEGTSPANFKDNYLYYYVYSQDGKSTINRIKVNY